MNTKNFEFKFERGIKNIVIENIKELISRHVRSNEYPDHFTVLKKLTS